MTDMTNSAVKLFIDNVVKKTESYHHELNARKNEMGINQKKRMDADLLIHNDFKIENLLTLPEREEVESERKIESSTNKIEVNNHERQEKQ